MFNQYPYLNLNDLNLDYLLNEIKSMYNDVTNFVSINAIKYADPIQWNITSQYEKNTVVIDPLTGTAYISVAAVPSGVALTRTEYWTVVFDLGSFVTRAAQNFTSHWESDTTLTATFSTSTGGWLVWGDVLYKALTNITAGDSYVVGGNIEHFTIEDLYNAYLNTVAQILAMIGNLVDLTTTDKTSIVNAINEVVSNFGTFRTEINNNFNAFKNEVNSQIMPVYNVKGHGGDNTGVTSVSLLVQSAINAGEKEIYFEEGTYLLDSDLILNSNNIRLYGNGHATTLLLDNASIRINGYYCNIYDITIRGNQNGLTGIVVNTSYNRLENVYFDEQIHFFQNAILVGDTGAAWFNTFSNIRINDVNTNTRNGYGITFKYAINCLVNECYIANKYCAFTTDDTNICEGIQIVAMNCVACWIGANIKNCNAIFMTNCIFDQIAYESTIIDNAKNIFIDSCYFAPALSAQDNYGAMNITNSTNVRIAKILANVLNNNYGIGIYSTNGLSIVESKFENVATAIILADANSHDAWFDNLYCTDVTTALNIQGAGNNNRYGNIYGGNVVLNDINQQKITMYNIVANIQEADIQAPYFDVHVPIKSIGRTIWQVQATVVNADAFYCLSYLRSSSSDTDIVIRVRRADGNNIGSLACSIAITFN